MLLIEEGSDGDALRACPHESHISALDASEPVIVSAAVMVGCTMVDRLEADPFSVIQDGDYVEVDADAGEVRVQKSGK